MTAQEVLATLKSLGKPQTAAIYKHYDSGDNVFGALTSDIAKIKKKIKVEAETMSVTASPHTTGDLA